MQRAIVGILLFASGFAVATVTTPGDSAAPAGGVPAAPAEALVEAAEWPAPEDAVVRPGVRIVDDHCTSNFLFESVDGTALYIGTAAHCVDDLTPGDPVSVAEGKVVGVLAYSSFHTMEAIGERDDGALSGNDFALVRIPDADRGKSHPAMLHWGGPTGMVATVPVGDHAMTYGNSRLRDGTPLPNEREGYVTSTTFWETEVHLLPGSVPGDSGSGVVLGDGAAIGALVTIGVGFGGGTDGPAICAACNGVTNVGPALDYARENAGLDVRLVTWPLFRSPELPDVGPR